MTGENSGGGGFFARSFRNLNRRGRWPLVSVEKDSHAQPPPAAMAVFPSPGPPPEERLGIGLTFPPDLSAHASWARFLVLGLWSRRLTEPPRPANIKDTAKGASR